MNIGILACSVFERELQKVLEEIKDDKLFNVDIKIDYLPFGLHIDFDLLENAIRTELDKLPYDKIIVLYGSKCHYNFTKILKDYKNVIRIKPSNCLEAILGYEIVDSYGKTDHIYLTSGWVEKFDELSETAGAVDEYDVLNQYGMYESAIIADTGLIDLSEEVIFDLFEKIRIPIEIEKTDLNIFKNLIIDAIQRAINS